VDGNDPLGAKRVGKDERRVSVLVHRRIVGFVLAAAFGLALVLVLSGASSAAPSNPHEPNPNAPFPIDGEPDTLVGFCDFLVVVEGEGKLKDIKKPDGSIISIAPGWRTTMTNLEEPENQITVHNTAPFHDTPLPNGDTLKVTTGQIFLLFDFDFTEELQQGIYLATGRTTVVEDAEGNWDASTFRNQGQLIDVCAILD
jgi:hypothetical protein